MAWEQRASLPAVDDGKCYAVSGGKIYAIGGYTSTTANYEYDPALNTWVSKASATVAVSDHQAAVRSSDGVIYVIQDGDSNEVRTYNPGTNTWAIITDSATAWNSTAGRYCWFVGDGSGNVYQGGGSTRTDVNRWNGSSWSNALTTMSPATAYEHSKAVWVSWMSAIYIHGGVVTGTSTYTAQMLKYTPPTTWATQAAASRTRWGHALVAANPWVYIIGGFGSGGYDQTIFRYDPALNTYNQWVNMPFAFPWKTAAAYVAPYLYVFTGHSGTTTTNLHYREEAGYDELSATMVGTASLDTTARLEAAITGTVSISGDTEITFDHSLESDSFIDIGETGSGTFDALFPALDLYPETTLYPGGDF